MDRATIDPAQSKVAARNRDRKGQARSVQRAAGG